MTDSIIYQSDGLSNLDALCSIRGKSLKNPVLMSHDEINVALDELSGVIEQRIKDSDQRMLFSSSQFYAPCESERMHDLKMALPSDGQQRLLAIDRNKKRRAKRKAELLAKRDQRNNENTVSKTSWLNQFYSQLKIRYGVSITDSGIEPDEIYARFGVNESVPVNEAVSDFALKYDYEANQL